jgi:hypothetical protein
VELPDNPSRDYQKGKKRESPSVESPSKLRKVKGFEKKAYQKFVVQGKLTRCSPIVAPKMLSRNL